MSAGHALDSTNNKIKISDNESKEISRIFSRPGSESFRISSSINNNGNRMIYDF
jgi:hypothetical protein